MSWTKRLFLLALIVMPVYLAGCITSGSDTSPVVGGVFKTVDNGTTWEAKSYVATTRGEKVNFHSLDVYTLVSDPQDPSALYAGTTQGLFYSYDFGESWQQARGLKTGSVYGVAVHPEESCHLFATTTRYLYESKDCGRTFEYIYASDAPNTAIGPILIDAYNPEIIYIGTVAGDLLKTLDGGKSWKVINRFEKPIYRILAGKDTRNLFVGVGKLGVLISNDGGNTWGERAKASVNLQKEFDGAKNVHDMDYSAESNTLIVASDYGLLRSTDDGETWESIPILTAPNTVPVYSVAIDPNNPNMIYYGTQKSFNYSTDGGNTWRTNVLPTASIAYDILVRGIALTEGGAAPAGSSSSIMVAFRIPTE